MCRQYQPEYDVVRWTNYYTKISAQSDKIEAIELFIEIDHERYLVPIEIKIHEIRSFEPKNSFWKK